MDLGYNPSNLKIRRYNELDFYLLDNDWVGSDILGGKVWEDHIVGFLSRNITQDNTFIDVGSNYGWHSLIMSKKCNKVYSFEPQKTIYSIQKLSIEKNNINNIELINCGIGNINTVSQMAPIDYFSSSVNMGDLSVGSQGQDIEIKTLDSFNIKANYIKVDVQGYEKFVVEGAANLIKECKPTFIIEFENHHLGRYGYNSKVLFELMSSLGYKGYYLEYFYPSDHVFVHTDNLSNFLEINKEHIKPHNTSNSLNFNFENGILEKIIK